MQLRVSTKLRMLSHDEILSEGDSYMFFDKNASPGQLMRSLAHRLRSDSLLRNSIFIMGSTVATSAIGYLYWVVAAHMYSAHDIGLASAFISVMTLTSIFVSLG